MPAVGSKVCLDPDMEIGNNKDPLFITDQQCRAFAHKTDIHKSRTEPFWGW
jgi:hypothetical protein